MGKLNLDPDTFEYKEALFRSLNTLKRAIGIRVANLKALFGNIKLDKQFTAESRKNFLERVDEKYGEKFSSSTEEDEINFDSSDPVPEGDPEETLIGLSAIDFEDYRDPEDLNYIPDPGFTFDIGTKKVYKAVSGTTKNYLSGIKSVKDSVRKFKTGIVNSLHGNKR